MGVDLEAQVQDLNSVKGRLGISDSMVRDYDTLMKDYALKYDSACQDVRAGRMAQTEYTCLRRNMTNALNDIRTFNQAVEAAKSLSDAKAQRDIVQKAFSALEQASSTNYRLGCTSAMNVNPTSISFTDDTLDNYVQITNGGNNDFTFSVEGLPAAFRPIPPAGKLFVTGTAALVIERTLGPVPPKQPIKFLVRTNLNDEQEVAITVDSENMNVWQRLGKKVRTSADTSATVEDALRVVRASTSSLVSELDKYVLASTLLVSMGQNGAAKVALADATNKDPSLDKDSFALFLDGIIANREQQPESALTYFAKAKDSAAPNEKSNWSAATDLASGIISFNLGKRNAADFFLTTDDLQKQVLKNPRLLDFGAQEFCSKGGCQAYANDRFAAIKKEGG